MQAERLRYCKKSLLLFIKKQKNGQIPLRIGRSILLSKILFFMKPRMKARYHIDVFFPTKKFSTDINSLFIIASANYIRESLDTKFVSAYYKNFEAAIKWNFSLAKNILIKDDGLTTWQDRIIKKGFVLYTNILYYKALKDMVFLARLAGKKDIFSKKAKNLRKKINEVFWNGNFFSDIPKDERFDFAGNVLAKMWFASGQQKKYIDMTIKKILKEKENFAMKSTFPPYSFYSIHLPFIFFLRKYHNNIWPWISCFHASILAKKDGFFILKKIAEKILEYHELYEVYDTNNKPPRSLFYRAERSFAWFAGSFIYAFHELRHK